jgi:hypothetical protein
VQAWTEELRFSSRAVREDPMPIMPSDSLRCKVDRNARHPLKAYFNCAVSFVEGDATRCAMARHESTSDQDATSVALCGLLLGATGMHTKSARVDQNDSQYNADYADDDATSLMDVGC